MSLLPCIEVETAPNVDSSIIWLHGLGANGHDFEPIVPEFNLPRDAAIRFVFPHAPSIPVTINNGTVMPAWYDIIDLTMDRHIDLDQIMKSSEQVYDLIKRENDRGIESRRIIIAGFSQGGAVAYQVALTWPEPLAGLVALSTYLATAETIKPHPDNKELPILACHGNLDMVVPEFLGIKAVNTLKTLDFDPEFKSYSMQHGVCPEEISDISAWLQKVLNL